MQASSQCGVTGAEAEVACLRKCILQTLVRALESAVATESISIARFSSSRIPRLSIK